MAAILLVRPVHKINIREWKMKEELSNDWEEFNLITIKLYKFSIDIFPVLIIDTFQWKRFTSLFSGVGSTLFFLYTWQQRWANEVVTENWKIIQFSIISQDVQRKWNHNEKWKFLSISISANCVNCWITKKVFSIFHSLCYAAFRQSHFQCPFC